MSLLGRKLQNGFTYASWIRSVSLFKACSIAVSLLIFTGFFTQYAQAATNSQIPDLSEWQGKLTAAQVKNLAKVEPFIILRVQQGSDYKDKYFAQNAALCKEYGLKYGFIHTVST